MRLRTEGMGEQWSVTDSQRAAGQLRGHEVTQESRDISSLVFSIFEPLRADPRKSIVRARRPCRYG